MSPTRRSFLTHSTLLPIATRLLSAVPFNLTPVFERYVASEHFSGMVLAGNKNRPIYTKAYGMADFESQTPVTSDTRFEGGSISKWIASVVVLHQVDRNALSLDTPIATYLPDFRKDNGSRLTLTHLMSHRSGVPNNVVPALRADPTLAEQDISQSEAVRRYASGDLQFKPGTAWDYSHSNWLLVKAVLERVTGERYEQLAAELLWDPLHLRHSGIFHGRSIAVRGMAQSYKPDRNGVPQLFPSAMPQFLTMAGGFYSTAPDMLHLLNAVVDGATLSAKSRELLFTVRVPESRYALGGRVRIRSLRGHQEEVVWEDGSNKGFRMLAIRIRRTGETVIFTNNTSCDQPTMGEFADDVLKIICAEA